MKRIQKVVLLITTIVICSCDPEEIEILTDCNGNGVEDAIDITDRHSFDVDMDGVPDECSGYGTIDCNENGILDGYDIHVGNSDDEDNDGIPDECECGWEGDVDCDQNGRVDSFDIADNPSLDTDSNGILDSCEDAADTLSPIITGY